MSEQPERRYGRVENCVMSDPTISAQGKALYALLATYAKSESRECWPSNATLAAEMGWTESTLRRHMAELRDKNVIARIDRKIGNRDPFLTTLLDRGRKYAPPGGANMRAEGAQIWAPEQEKEQDQKNKTTSGPGGRPAGAEPAPPSRNEKPVTSAELEQRAITKLASIAGVSEHELWMQSSPDDHGAIEQAIHELVNELGGSRARGLVGRALRDLAKTPRAPGRLMAAFRIALERMSGPHEGAGAVMRERAEERADD